MQSVHICPRRDAVSSKARCIATWTNRKPEVMVQVVEHYNVVLELKQKTFWPSAKNVSVALVHDMISAQWAPPNSQWPITEGSDDADTFKCRYLWQVLQAVSTIQVVYPALTREFLRSKQVRICQSWFKRHIFWTWFSILAAVFHIKENPKWATLTWRPRTREDWSTPQMTWASTYIRSGYH